VKGGALFYQEFLPPETLFYATVLANPVRQRFAATNPAELLNRLQTWLPPYLQIGGDETIGKGLCATRFSIRTEGPTNAH
jgi:CRISPR-associated protein Cmr4